MNSFWPSSEDSETVACSGLKKLSPHCETQTMKNSRLEGGLILAVAFFSLNIPLPTKFFSNRATPTNYDGLQK